LVETALGLIVGFEKIKSKKYACFKNFVGNSLPSAFGGSTCH
jgi:hypothetical protein